MSDSPSKPYVIAAVVCFACLVSIAALTMFIVFSDHPSTKKPSSPVAGKTSSPTTISTASTTTTRAALNTGLTSSPFVTNPPNTPTWVQTNGAATKVAVNDSYAFAASGSDSFYRAKDGSNGWTSLDKSLRSVDVAGQHLVGLDSDNNMHRCSSAPNCLNNWSTISGNQRSLSTNGNYVFSTNDHDEIYTCTLPCSGGMTRAGNGLLKELSVGPNYLWGINGDKDIYNCPLPCTTDGAHRKQPGKATWIDAKDPDNVWVVGTDGEIYSCKQPCQNAVWEKRSSPPGGLDIISGSKNRLWGLKGSTIYTAAV